MAKIKMKIILKCHHVYCAVGVIYTVILLVLKLFFGGFLEIFVVDL